MACHLRGIRCCFLLVRGRKEKGFSGAGVRFESIVIAVLRFPPETICQTPAQPQPSIRGVSEQTCPHPRRSGCCQAIDEGPLPPPPSRPAPAIPIQRVGRDVADGRARPGDRSDVWPPQSEKSTWRIARIVLKGELHVGWGATCRCHVDPDKDLVCKKQLLIGKHDTLTLDECRLRMMAWLMEGTQISSSSLFPRKEHVFDIKPRELLLQNEADLERAAIAHWDAQ